MYFNNLYLQTHFCIQKASLLILTTIKHFNQKFIIQGFLKKSMPESSSPPIPSQSSSPIENGTQSIGKAVKNGIKRKNTSRAPVIPWTTEDDLYLLQCIKQFGYGAWEKISKEWERSPGRTQLQLKNRAKHGRDGSRTLSAEIRQGITEAFELRYGKDGHPRAHKDRARLNKKKSKKVSDDSLDSNLEFADYDEIDECEDSTRNPSVDSTSNSSRTSAHLSSDDSHSVVLQLLSSQHDEILTPNENVENFSPKASLIVTLDEITMKEKMSNAEFFDESDPERSQLYLLVRNEIMKLWSLQRPVHLSVKECKAALKAVECQDTAAISSIYNYLDNNQLINCITDQHFIGNLYEKDGKTTSKKQKETKKPSRPVAKQAIKTKPVLTKRKQSGVVKDKKEDLYDDDYFLSSITHDQFCLVGLKAGNVKKVYFRVEMNSDQLALIDFHSHLMHTEVIGLLGGSFDEESGLLSISSSFACRSISTGTECEMDPMSELEATNYFSKLDLSVVGWYHSHPTFQPDPSIRDLDTQWSYQQLITDQGTRKRPFVGLIVSPYDKTVCSLPPYHSTYRMFWLTDELDEITMRQQKPIQCPLELREISPTMADFESLFERCKCQSHFVNLTELLEDSSSSGGMRRIDKLNHSLGQFFTNPTNTQLIDKFIDGLKTDLNGFAIC